MKNIFSVLICLTILSCSSSTSESRNDTGAIKVGCEQMDDYLPLLKGKNIGIVANHSTIIGESHLVDSLLSRGINIVKIFSPEHGFRGDGDAGEHIKSHTDSITGLPVISLYGSSKKPHAKDLDDIEIMLFDMQDVGVRFYTYISTMHYVMEACAEENIPFMVLDRPNPNGFFVDGPMLDTNFRSFVGMHPVPLVHGMTIGEFAQMINGEKWLESGAECDLTVISCLNYTHDSTYTLPVRPSPNLPNQAAVYHYPSLGFFEGTVVSVGRGTDFPFQVFGHPDFPPMGFDFTPESRPGASKNPPYLGQLCYGFDLREYSEDYFIETSGINLDLLIFAYQLYPDKKKFFNSYFNVLAGNSLLRKQIEQGVEEMIIKQGWKPDIERFMEVRARYLLYPDFSR